jgi:hypothetical protein
MPALRPPPSQMEPTPVPGIPLATLLQHGNRCIARDVDRQVLLLQVVLALKNLHEAGYSHGCVAPCSVHVAYGLLCQLCGDERPPTRSIRRQGLLSTGHAIESCSDASTSATCQRVPRPTSPLAPAGLETEYATVYSLGSDLTIGRELWRNRLIGNFEYLLFLNALAGRAWGSLQHLPFIPWVLDFSADPKQGLEHRCKHWTFPYNSEIQACHRHSPNRQFNDCTRVAISVAWIH